MPLPMAVGQVDRFLVLQEGLRCLRLVRLPWLAGLVLGNPCRCPLQSQAERCIAPPAQVVENSLSDVSHSEHVSQICIGDDLSTSVI